MDNNFLTIVLLIGIPGSGKSFYLSNINDIVFDDISQIKDGLNQLKEQINSNKNKIIYISDVNFCDIEILKEAKNKILKLNENESLIIKFKHIIFKSTEKISINNVSYRNDGRLVLPTIKRFAPKLDELIIYLMNEQQKEDILFINTPIMPLSVSNNSPIKLKNI